jgi:hypothetical protein
VSFLKEVLGKKDTRYAKKTQGKREGCSLLGAKKEQAKSKKEQAGT